MLFVGTHERQLDEKGRVALPATFRTQLGERCYLVFGEDQCIDVFPSEVFETMARQLMEKVERGDATMQRQRAVSGSATVVNVDKQGRINIEEKLRTYAGLQTEHPVVVAGNFNRIEIWSPERHARDNAAGMSELAGDDATA